MSWWDRWKKRKTLCHVCGVNPLPKDPAIIRLAVQDGTAEMSVCNECADFFEQSAEILNRGKRDEPI